MFGILFCGELDTKFSNSFKIMIISCVTGFECFEGWFSNGIYSRRLKKYQFASDGSDKEQVLLNWMMFWGNWSVCR